MCLSALVFSSSLDKYPAVGWLDHIYGRCILSFLRILPTAFHSGCTSLHSHQQCRRVPFSPHPLQLLSPVLLTRAILTRVRGPLLVVLICTCLIANDVEHLSLCLLAIRISSLEKSLLRSFARFLNWVVDFCCC
uniref:Uncharacterized protein n=1 Tax=Equus caballus TaxID=9796 RepID=A0A9L0TMR0_HORSE